MTTDINKLNTVSILEKKIDEYSLEVTKPKEELISK